MSYQKNPGIECEICDNEPGLLETWKRWRVHRLELKLAKLRSEYPIRICLKHSMPLERNNNK